MGVLLSGTTGPKVAGQIPGPMARVGSSRPITDRLTASRKAEVFKAAIAIPNPGIFVRKTAIPTDGISNVRNITVKSFKTTGKRPLTSRRLLMKPMRNSRCPMSPGIGPSPLVLSKA